MLLTSACPASSSLPFLVTILFARPVQFLLQTFKRNGFHAVAMPNEKFVWTSSNTTVATVSSTGLVQSLNFGSTNITCAFVDMAENNAQVNLYVVEPNYLGIEVSEIFTGCVEDSCHRRVLFC